MGTYCTRAYIQHHPARAGEIIEVRRLTDEYGSFVALLGDKGEIACIPHRGCRLEIVATADTRHLEANLLLPGQVLRYQRSFLLRDRVELPSGTRLGFRHLVGFKLQLAPPTPSTPPAEEAIVEGAAQRTRQEIALD